LCLIGDPLDQPVSELRVHATVLRPPHMWLPQTSKPELRNGTATDGDPTRERIGANVEASIVGTAL
jgi:hypothetical protein